MQLTPDGELPLETCTACGAVWFEGNALHKVMGGSVSDALLRRAKDKSGSCKGCQGELRYVPECSHCGTRSPTCPRCGHAPMPVVEVFGVPMEVCSGCAGVALDAGELQQLRDAVETHRNEPLDARARVRLEERPCCTACRRNLKLEHGFVSDERLYCGSCAPAGSAPYSETFSPSRGDVPLFVPTRRGGQSLNIDGYAAKGLMWLLHKMFTG
ncbi:zf-TFIIB domain-containing protein [Myxococcus sp. 1LA]